MLPPILRASIALRIAGAVLAFEWAVRVLVGFPILPISMPPYVGLAVYAFGDVLRLMEHARRLRAPPAAPKRSENGEGIEQEDD